MSTSNVSIVEIEERLGKVVLTLDPIDKLVDEIHVDLARLASRDDKDGGHGEADDDEDRLVSTKYVEVSSLALQLKNDVKQLKRVLDANPHGGGWYHASSSSVARRPSMEMDTPPVEDLLDGNPRDSDPAALSLESLDGKLRRCLLCLAAFPAGVEAIKKRLLLHWWIGEGFVESIDAAKECFRELVSGGFLQPALHREHCRGVHYCRVNPSVRPRLVDAARNDGFLEFDEEDNPVQSNRRLCLRGNEAAGVRGGNETRGGRWRRRRRRNNSDDDDDGKLLTIYNINQQFVRLDRVGGKPAKTKSLAVLQLGRWRTSVKEHHVELAAGADVLKRAFMCKNLRYLSLRGISLIESLPESIGNLRELVVLDLRACHNLENLPASVGALSRLEYIDVSECLLDAMPEELSCLSNLVVLKGFVVGRAQSKVNPCRLAILARMPRLRKLKLCTGKHCAVAGDDELRHLEHCDNLRSLTIVWGTKGVSSMIALPARLEKLDLQRTPMNDLLQFIQPSTSASLRKLYIRGGRLRAMTGGAACWKNVEILRVRFLKNMECEWRDLQTSFPNVMVVENWGCDKLASWPCNHLGVWKRGETVTRSATSFVGVCYGMRGTDLPSPMEVVELYKSNNIRLMRLYHPNHQVLSALCGSGIGIILGVGDNSILESLGYDQAAATNWVRTNVQAYSPGVSFQYITVGMRSQQG
uniref:Disease resistance R13L4/SHOC-2-like LRR domain-containing protein n=1 Tax=Oryza barthii TaxID=65489 RepID=A0A0D3HBP6_9ORYZ